MTLKKTKTTLLLNWYANPYHTPIFMAKNLGYYGEEEIKLAILEPTDPSDVTEIVGRGCVDLGLKAMVHCYAARGDDYPIQSIGTLLDEPPTGLLVPKKSGIQTFADIKGKRIGYVGQFGKVIIDDLLQRAGIASNAYYPVRVGMSVTDAIVRGQIDAGIGISCFQQVELEQHFGECEMLRIDELAGLGCCCFCSVLFITQEQLIQDNPELLTGFMKATQRGLAFTLENPEKAFQLMCAMNPRLNSELYRKIFVSCLPFFSRNLLNVERDWKKVGKYAEHLGIVEPGYDPVQCYTNAFVPTMPHAKFAPLEKACTVGCAKVKS